MKKKAKAYICQPDTNDLEPLLTVAKEKLKHITVSDQVVFEANCAKSVLVSTQADGLIEKNPRNNNAKNPTCKRAIEIIDVYQECFYCSTAVNIDKVHLHLRNNQRVGKVTNTPFELVNIKD